MKLFVLPGACSLASHVALETVGRPTEKDAEPWEVVVLDRERNHDPAYTAINPLGTVPALVTADGRTIVESIAVLMHIAEAYPQAGLAPPVGSHDRDRLLMLLSMMATTGHTAFQMLWRPERFADTEDARQAVRRMAEARIATVFDRLEREVGPCGNLVGDRLGLADMYLWVLTRWGLRLTRPTPHYPTLWAFTERMATTPAVVRAMATEGVVLHQRTAGVG